VPTTPAEQVRRHLAASRERGLPFEAAWARTLAEMPALDHLLPRTRERRDRDQWAAALRWSRPAFERAYLGAEPAQAERAAARLTAI
jgi:hypothetical protein